MLGPSGCGKTTTLRMIGGFEEPTSGRILLQGEDVTWVPPAKRNVNMVFQAYGLFPHMTVAAERRLRAAHQAHRARRDDRPRGRGAAHRAAGGPGRAPPPPALRRPAAARRAGPGAGQPPGRPAPGRAAGRPRPEAAPPDAAGAEVDRGPDRNHLRLRHARPGGGADDVRPDRRHERGRGRAGGGAARAVRASQNGVRGRVHRHLEPAGAAGRRAPLGRAGDAAGRGPAAARARPGRRRRTRSRSPSGRRR